MTTTINHLYKHVLLATDLSDNANAIAKRAADLAHAAGAKLSVMHVLSHAPVAYAGEFSIPIDAEFEATLEKEAKTQLAKLGKKYHISANDQHLAQGSVKSTVTEFADTHKVDLIVVGTHGREGISLLLGSQANAILHAAKCDVWVVHVK